MKSNGIRRLVLIKTIFVKRTMALLVSLIVLSGCGGEQLALVDGTHTRIDDWKGRWVVINYWAE